MNPRGVDVTILLDKSGSMESLKDETFNSVKRFIADRAEDDAEVTVTLIQFDTSYQVTLSPRPASEAASAAWAYRPMGSTALHDAVVRAINETGERLKHMSEALRPSKVIFVISTDGQENSSQKHQLSDVQALIKQQQDTWKWQFIFLGIGIDAFHEGVRGLHVNSGGVMSVGNTPVAVASAYAAASAGTRRYVHGNTADAAFTTEEYDNADATGGVKNTRTSPLPK